MGGGLMQLVAYGAQDIYLTGNPQITFFKVVYRRHTNFSMEAIEQTFNGNPDFGKKVSCTISRNGDLIHRIYLQTTLPEVNLSVDGVESLPLVGMGKSVGKFNWVNWVGHQLIKNVEVEIGGQRIDKHYGEWLHLWNELTQSPGLQAGYARMVGNVPRLVNPNAVGGGEEGAVNYNKTTLYIPLQFWFCRNPGLALPLIALQYHEVKINVEFNDLNKCAVASDVDGVAVHLKNTDLRLDETSLWVDYMYLDTDERRRFAQVSHEYLIEQLQFTGEESINSQVSKIKLNFNHPVKELVWVVQPAKNINQDNKQYFNFSDAVDSTFLSGSVMDPLGMGLTGPLDLGLGGLNDGLQGSLANDNIGFANPSNVTEFDKGVNPVVLAKLQLNGHDRFSERRGDYFNYVQPYQHHTNVPSLGINVYSFGLKPEEHQPSGTCNFSRIDNATLHLTVTSNTTSNQSSGHAKVRVYATNYNVLRIMSGMGGLAYSN